MNSDHPERQTLPAHSFAEDERILLSRVGFVHAFFPDPRVDAFLREIDRDTDLLAAATRYAALARDLTARIGWADRSVLWLARRDELAAAIDAVPVTDDYRALVEHTQAAQADVHRAYHHADYPILAARLEVFVRGLGLPWRWLALELAAHYFHTQFFALLFGRHVDRELCLVFAPGRPFRPEPDEDLRDAWTHYADTLKLAAEMYAKAQRRNKQAGEKADGQHLERYAEAFYRRHVKHEHFRQIARDQQTSSAHIKYGIRVVEPLLNRDRLP